MSLHTRVSSAIDLGKTAVALDRLRTPWAIRINSTAKWRNCRRFMRQQNADDEADKNPSSKDRRADSRQEFSLDLHDCIAAHLYPARNTFDMSTPIDTSNSQQVVAPQRFMLVRANS